MKEECKYKVNYNHKISFYELGFSFNIQLSFLLKNTDCLALLVYFFAS